MITYIMKIEFGQHAIKEWRSWNIKPLIKKLTKIKEEIPAYARGYSAPELDTVIKYFILNNRKDKIRIEITEDKNRNKKYFEVEINEQGDIIKDDNNSY